MPSKSLPFLLSFLLPVLIHAHCMPPEQVHKEIDVILQRSKRFGVPNDSYQYLRRALNSFEPDPSTNPPCYDSKAFSKYTTQALFDCLEGLPPGPKHSNRQKHTKSTSTDRNVVPVRRKIQQKAMVRFTRRNTGRQGRSPHKNGGRGGGNTEEQRYKKRYNNCMRRLGPTAHTQCIQILSNDAAQVCHCFTGCHFCCIVKGLAMFDNCFEKACYGVAWCS